ncbi:hypothetical protein AAMO2058_001498400 [Amorphochlora amoebiformis]
MAPPVERKTGVFWGCCKSLLTCDFFPRTHRVYHDRALGNENVTTAKDAPNSTEQPDTRPKWQQNLEFLDFLTAYRPFTLIDHYFLPYSTGPSMAYLLVSILFLVFFAITVFSSNRAENRLLFARPNGKGFVLPPTGVGIRSTTTQTDVRSEYSISFYQTERSYSGDNTVTIRRTLLPSSGCDSGNALFDLKTCIDGTAVLQSSLTDARLSPGTSKEIEMFIRSDTSHVFQNVTVSITVQRHDGDMNFEEVFSDAPLELQFRPQTGLVSDVQFYYAESVFEEDNSLFFINEESFDAAVYQGYFDTPYAFNASIDNSTLFVARFQFQGVELLVQETDFPFVDQLGLVCGFGAFLYLFGFLFRWYNKYHFHRQGNFEDSNIEPSFMKHFLHTDKNYTPPGIKSLADQNLNDRTATDTSLKQVLENAEEVRQLVDDVLKTRRDLRNKLYNDDQNVFTFRSRGKA